MRTEEGVQQRAVPEDEVVLEQRAFDREFEVQYIWILFQYGWVLFQNMWVLVPVYLGSGAAARSSGVGSGG